MDINVQEELKGVTDQITRLVDELNKINAGRDQLIQQIQNLNGVAMYLRGKLPLTEPPQPDVVMVEEPAEDVEGVTRTVEYPTT